MFWITYSNLNNFHVEIFVRLENMQKLFKFKNMQKLFKFKKIDYLRAKKKPLVPVRGTNRD